MVEQMQQGQVKDKESGGFHGFSAFIFLIFGVILILKLMNLNIAFLQYIPEIVLYWIAAIGSTFGGLYMIYKKYIYRHKFYMR